MDNKLRNIRQKEISDEYLKSNRFGILNVAPRMGKCFISINILEHYSLDCRILIAYPDVKIKDSWIEDFEKRGYFNPNVTYTTHLSLKKCKGEMYDLIIIDEIHLLSPAQIIVCEQLFVNNRAVLGLTGTLSRWTRRVLSEDLGLNVLINYPISKAIEEGIIPDYEINVIKVPLDNRIPQLYKNKKSTEYKKFKSYSFVIDKLQDEGKDTKFLRLSRMRIIQNSIAKVKKTKDLLSLHKSDRVLVFCGLIKIAESLGIDAHHSKSKNKEVFEDFVTGGVNHLAVVRIGNTGVTYKPLSMVIMNYFDSNSENFAQKVLRCMSFEYDNPEKKAKIYIISSTEPVEQKWLLRALEFFDEKKIKYI